jgi:beta-1,4-mannosyl-glycoprotein beta-1,4-N-acetylglucosaminyltransferase
MKKIFSCFPFFNELELLELRLMEQYDVVDHFIIVEATRTHQGKPHEPQYLAYRERYRSWQDKIIHILVEDLPIYDTTQLIDWRPENYQRNAIQRGLEDIAQPGDRVLIADADEIVYADVIRELSHTDATVSCRLDVFYYYLNTQFIGRVGGNYPMMASYGNFNDCQSLRNISRKHKIRREHAGAHCSYMGNNTTLNEKVNNIAETIYAEQEHQVVANLYERKNALIEPLARSTLHVGDTPNFRGITEFVRKYPHFLYTSH